VLDSLELKISAPLIAVGRIDARLPRKRTDLETAGRIGDRDGVARSPALCQALAVRMVLSVRSDALREVAIACVRHRTAEQPNADRTAHHTIVPPLNRGERERNRAVGSSARIGYCRTAR